MLFVNGIPTATAELKNRWTGQTYRDAVHQYETDRDPANLLFARRAFVHFALDAEEAYMTTRLAGRAHGFCRSTRAVTVQASQVALGIRETQAGTRRRICGGRCGIEIAGLS